MYFKQAILSNCGYLLDFITGLSLCFGSFGDYDKLSGLCCVNSEFEFVGNPEFECLNCTTLNFSVNDVHVKLIDLL